jgi:hypothetical protein
VSWSKCDRSGFGEAKKMLGSQFKLSGVSAQEVTYKGRSALEVKVPTLCYQDPVKDILSDRDFMAWLPLDFSDGAIEVSLSSVIAPDAPAFARGFIGISFRIDNNGRFESFYLRPANSRVDDQIRRNHSVQYAAFPEYTFARLRKEEPEKYESYVDLALEQWIEMRIDVRGATARLFINGQEQPSLIVSDLKLGERQRGGVGLWIETGTVGYFTDLKIDGKAVT